MIRRTAETFVENPAAYEDAVRRYIRANASATRARKFREEHADADQILAYIEAQADKGNRFWSDVWAGVCEYGAPRPRIVEIARERIAKDAQRRAEFRARDAGSQHVGEIGQRLEFVANVTFVATYETELYGMLVITGLRDDAGNIFIHKGSREMVEKGQRVSVRGTVKSHDERDGVKQTRISRPVYKPVEG